jgi:PAS domain S-box-containing protein
MRLSLTSPVWTWTTALLALLFIIWSANLIASVYRLQERLSDDVAAQNKLASLEKSLRGLQKGLPSVAPNMPSSVTDQWPDLQAKIREDLDGLQGSTLEGQNTQELLARFNAWIRQLNVIHEQLATANPDPSKREDFEAEFRTVMYRAVDEVNDAVRSIRTRQTTISISLASKWRPLNVLVLVSCGQSLLLAVLLGLNQRHFDRRRKVEEDLAQQRYLLEALMDNLPDSIYFKDTQSRFLRINKALADRLKLEDAVQAAGRTDFDFSTEEYAKSAYQDEQEVMISGHPLRSKEEKITGFDGSEQWVLTTKMPLRSPQGNIVGTFGVSRDISERKLAEEALRASERRYRQLTEASLDAVVVADQQGDISLFNRAAEEIFGFRAREVIGKPLTILMPPEFHDRFQRGFKRFLETRESHFVGGTVQLPGRRQEGSEFPLEISLSAIDLGSEIQFLGAIRDLSESKRLRALVMQHEKLASLGQLSAGIAHEINNPLGFVANNLVVLQWGTRGLLSLMEIYASLREHLAETAPEAVRQLETIEREVDLPFMRANLGQILERTTEGVKRVTSIVKNLRGMARTNPEAFQETNLPELITTTLEMIRGRLRHRNIEVELDYGPHPSLRCISTEICQVLLNLLVNAIQAIEQAGRIEGGRIRVTTRRVDTEAIIEVEDNGCGIPPEDMPRLFDPFFTTKPVGEGTGLGLSITDGIVTGHGGRIEVESQPGKGSCFRIRLPSGTKV